MTDLELENGISYVLDNISEFLIVNANVHQQNNLPETLETAEFCPTTEFCDLSFSTNNAPNSSFQLVEAENNQQLYSIEGCDIETYDQYLIENQDLLLKPKEFTCPICKKQCKSSSTLRTHEKTHSDTRPYVCSACPKSFKIRGDLKRHYRIHTNERPYQCRIEGCDLKFITSDNRKCHELIHQNIRLFTCSQCTKSFSNKRNLVNHENIHTKTKPYVCNVCERRFTEYSSWYKHSRVHKCEKDEEQRIHKCKLCQRAYKNRGCLEKHLKQFHLVHQEETNQTPEEEPVINELHIAVCDISDETVSLELLEATQGLIEIKD